MKDTLEDPDLYLQRRVALFSGATSAFFAFVLVVDFAIPAEGEPMLGSTRVASLAVVLVYAAAWLYARGPERPGWWTRAIELAGITTAAATFGTLALHPPIAGAGGVMTLFAPLPMMVLLTLRAALVPSPAWLSALIAVLWGGLATVSGLIGWEHVQVDIPNQPESDDRILGLAINVFATVGVAFVCAVISRVVHGLQEKVREAMQLGQYTLETKIGEGGMGAVYRARHAMLRRPTAIKLLPPEKSSEEAIARFEREVQQTSRLSHPNTVSIFDFGRTRDGIFYYAMEYLDGISLELLVKRFGPVSEERAIHILRQASEALGEAHAMGLVHRDVKPDNIVLCERGGVSDVVKVVDFGLVKDLDAPPTPDVSASGKIQGTPPYMAPETIRDGDAVDARTDLYALGGVAYYLLTGEQVFEGDTVEVLSHHLRTPPQPPSERRGDPIDPALEAIVMRLLAKDPADRFATGGALADALAALDGSDGWTRRRAQTWWDAHRADVDAIRDEGNEPSGRTLAPR